MSCDFLHPKRGGEKGRQGIKGGSHFEKKLRTESFLEEKKAGNEFFWSKIMGHRVFFGLEIPKIRQGTTKILGTP